jgi:hypothetical protein
MGSFAQKKNILKKPNKKEVIVMVDSCLRLNDVITKYWSYHKKGNYYKDSSRIFYHINSYPAFVKCLSKKTDMEIYKMLGRPSNYDSLNINTNYNYCLIPNNNTNCCKISLYFIFDSARKVKNVEVSNCNVIKD